MNVVKSKEFWIGVAATFVVLKFVAPKIPALSSVTSKLSLGGDETWPPRALAAWL